MPTYEYLCRQCGKKFDKLQKITDLPVKKCPSCGGDVDRIITGGSGFLLNGSGFYATDYRSDSYKKAAAKDKSDNFKTPPVTAEKKKDSGNKP